MAAANLTDVLRHRAFTDAERVAYAFGGELLTYRALLHESLRLAERLSAHGIGAGDRVAIVLPAGLDFVRAFWGAQLAGAASVAINPWTPKETTQRRVARVEPHAIIDASALTITQPRPARCPLPAAFLQPTSGTSGEPRAAMITHANVLAVQQSAVDAVSLCAQDVLVAWVPPWHDLGLMRFVIGAVYFGATCHIVTPSVRTIPEWLAKIEQVRATITGAPDFAFRLAARASGTFDLRSLRYVTNGGEPVRLSTIVQFEERFGLRGIVRPGYGLAEATLGVSGLLPGEPVRVDERGHVSCGTPLPDVEVRIAGDGEILVRGPGVFAGYYDAAEATAEALRDGWLYTGDMGYRDADGHLYVLGRRRAMLKRGGAMLAPRELEELAQEVDGVRIAAAVGLPHGLTEEIAVAVESEEQAKSVSAEVARVVRRALGFAPRVVVLRPRSIPRTANGKIQHGVLRTRLRDGSLADAILDDGR